MITVSIPLEWMHCSLRSLVSGSRGLSPSGSANGQNQHCFRQLTWMQRSSFHLCELPWETEYSGPLSTTVSPPRLYLYICLWSMLDKWKTFQTFVHYEDGHYIISKADMTQAWNRWAMTEVTDSYSHTVHEHYCFELTHAYIVIYYVTSKDDSSKPVDKNSCYYKRKICIAWSLKDLAWFCDCAFSAGCYWIPLLPQLLFSLSP